MMRILVVEDEEALASALQEWLGKQGYHGDLVHTVHDTYDFALSGAYDCLLVDVMLPDGNGIELIKELRSLNCVTPAIILTARNAPEDRVNGLNAGADDYIGKPFDAEELIARIQAVVRRTTGQKELNVLEHGAMKLFRESRTLQVKQQIIELSSKEYLLMEYLFRHSGQVLTREQLILHAWGPDAEVADNALDTYIYFLRKKCKEAGVRNAIKTVRGQGYILHST